MSRKPIFYGISIFFLLWIPFAAIFTRAHAASSISLNYNSSTNVLTATIFHSVPDAGSHFIDTVQIDINGSTELFLNYTSQPTTTTFSYTYSFTAAAGDIITVLAHCNLSGTITRSLTIEGEQSDPDVSGSIPGYLGVMMFIIASVFIASLFIHKKIKKN